MKTLKTLSRRPWLQTVLSTGLLLGAMGTLALSPYTAAAQSAYPSKPIRHFLFG